MKLFIDAGNYNIKTMSEGGELLVIRSLYATVPFGQTPKSHTPESPLLKIPSENDAIHIGAKARYYRTCQAVVNGDKLDPKTFIPTVLASMTAVYNDRPVELVLSMPNSYRSSASLATLLVKRHHFYRNGVEMSVNVTGVTTHLEGLGAWKHAQSMNLLSSTGYTLLIDIGGSTVNALVLDSQGELVGESLSYDKRGGIALASLIADDSRLKTTLADEPAVDIIMEGIANGSWMYAETGISFGHTRPLVNIWFKGLMSNVSANVKPHLPNVRKILFSGGNAHLLQDVVVQMPLAAVVPQPALANILGLVKL